MAVLQQHLLAELSKLLDRLGELSPLVGARTGRPAGEPRAEGREPRAESREPSAETASLADPPLPLLPAHWSTWVIKISPRIPRGRANLRDQLVGASDSVVLNIAEGAAVAGKAGKNHHRIALREVAECNAAVHLLVVAGLEGADEALELTYRIRAMRAGLTR